MRLSLCLVSLLQTHSYAAPLSVSHITLAALLSTPALGEESSCAVDASSGEEVCAPLEKDTAQTQDAIQAEDEPDSIIDEDESGDDEDSDDEGDDYETYDDDELADDEEDAEGRPIWWNYSIDELFEDLWDCGEIVYGYEARAEEDGKDDANANEGVRDGDGNDSVASGGKREEVKGSAQVSEAQIRHLQQQWEEIREKYVKEIHLVPIVHEMLEDSTTEEDAGNGGEKIATVTTTLRSRGQSSLVVPVRIGDAGPHKGRGVYATAPIPKGTLVSDLDNGSTGIFKTGHSWREFAATLPRMTACNFIEWSWVQTVPAAHEGDDDIRNGLTIFVAFDESNLLNSADWDDIEANVRCGTPPVEEGGERGPCRFQYYAARDIDAGEELLIDYGEFEDLSQQGWTDIGL